MELEIRHLRYFLTLTDEASFTRAAARLGIAQSALSAQIQRLERHLGVQLIRRVSRRLELTAAGEELAVRARAILASVHAAETAVRAQAGRTPLRVGCFRVAWWPHEMNGVVEDRMPGAQVVTETVDPADGLRQLVEGRLDVCLCFDFPFLPRDVPAALSSTEVLREPVWVALPAGHPAASADTVSLSALAGEDWLLQPRGSYLRRAVEHLCREAGFAPRAVASGDSWELAGLIAQGRGVTLCSPTVIPRDGFVTRPVDPVRWRRIFAAWRADRPTASAVPAVVAAFTHLYHHYLRQISGSAASPQAQPDPADHAS